MSINSCAEITIGLPVFNEERFIRETIQSLLDQDFQDFKLIIADNCSSDRTYEICEEYSQIDSRVVLHQHSKNLGASRNFNYVLQTSKSPYFLWAGSHDLWSRNFLSETHSCLQTHPDAVLAYCPTQVIDAHGELKEALVENAEYIEPIPTQRACRLITSLTWCNMFYGLYRTEALQPCRHDLKCIGPDHVILMELALRGEIRVAPNATFFRREYRPSCNSDLDNHRAQLQRIVGEDDVSRALATRYTQWWWQHLKSAWRVPGSFRQKLLRLQKISCCFVNRWGSGMEFKSIVYPHQAFRILTSPLQQKQNSDSC